MANIDIKKCKVNSTVLLFAVRYAIGRMSYAPAMVADTIRENINVLTDNDLDLILKEIDSCYNYGMDFDKTTWLNLKEFIINELNNRQK